MQAKIAGFILLLGLSAAAYAHPGHHHPNTVEQPQTAHQPKTFETPPAADHGHVPVKMPQDMGGGVSNAGGGGVTAPIPEPETYAMIMAGLGIVAAAARRRQKKAGTQAAGMA